MPNKLTVFAGAVLLASGIATATPINITSQLTGDPRANNPDNLVVDVTIVSDTTWNYAFWTVDINSPLHPNIKLDQFYFNLTGVAVGYTFDSFSPTSWSISAPGTVQGGGGGNQADFLFEADTCSGQSQSCGEVRVTNAQDLTFRMLLTGVGATVTEDMFLNAATWSSSDTVLGGGQMGAHLQSLSTTGCTGCSDSGFAVGDYSSSSSSSSSSTGGGTGSSEIPEPGTVSLLGIAMLGGLVMWRRRRIGA